MVIMGMSDTYLTFNHVLYTVNYMSRTTLWYQVWIYRCYLLNIST